MPPAADLVTQWLRKAEGDLHIAELVLADDSPVYWGAAFHAQQATEKFIKALLTFHEIEFAKSHDIEYLFDLCVPVEPDIERFRDAAARLTEFAVETRYPGPEAEPAESEAPKAIGTARAVREYVLDALSGGAPRVTNSPDDTGVP